MRYPTPGLLRPCGALAGQTSASVHSFRQRVRPSSRHPPRPLRIVGLSLPSPAYRGFEIPEKFVVGYGFRLQPALSQPALHRCPETRADGTLGSFTQGFRPATRRQASRHSCRDVVEVRDAGVVKLADARDSKSRGLRSMRVRPPPPALLTPRSFAPLGRPASPLRVGDVVAKWLPKVSPSRPLGFCLELRSDE